MTNMQKSYIDIYKQGDLPGALWRSPAHIALIKYCKDPTPENKQTLRDEYERIPEDDRRFCLCDQDWKDTPIRVILYGDESEDDNAYFVISKQTKVDKDSITIGDARIELT